MPVRARDDHDGLHRPARAVLGDDQQVQHGHPPWQVHDAGLFRRRRPGADPFDNPRVQMHVSRTLAHVQIGALDAAADALRPILETPAEQRLSTVAARLDEVTAALTRPTFVASREAGSMRQAILTFQVESAAPALPADD